MSTELIECNDNLRRQPYNTFIIAYFPSCLLVLASSNVLPLSVHITYKVCLVSFATMLGKHSTSNATSMKFEEVNACPHTAAIVQQFLAKKGVAQLSHPHVARFNPPPFQLFRFPKLKLESKFDHYALIEDIQK